MATLVDGILTPNEQLDMLQQQLDKLLSEAADARREEEANMARAADWRRKYAESSNKTKDPHDLEIAAEADAAANVAKARASQIDNSIKQVRERIASTQEDVRKYNAGLADAASKGLTGEAAKVAAAAHVQEAQSKASTMKIVAIAVAVAALVIFIVWVVPKLKSLKKV